MLFAYQVGDHRRPLLAVKRSKKEWEAVPNSDLTMRVISAICLRKPKSNSLLQFVENFFAPAAGVTVKEERVSSDNDRGSESEGSVESVESAKKAKKQKKDKKGRKSKSKRGASPARSDVSVASALASKTIFSL